MGAPRRKVAQTTLVVIAHRWAALRPETYSDGLRMKRTGREYIDLSTLSDTEAGARALADRRDIQDHRLIRLGEALAHTRITRVRIEQEG